MADRITSYRDLKVWQLGIDRVVDVYRACESLPKQEMYGLASQMQRARFRFRLTSPKATSVARLANTFAMWELHKDRGPNLKRT